MRRFVLVGFVVSMLATALVFAPPVVGPAAAAAHEDGPAEPDYSGDKPLCAGSAATIVGTAGDDVLVGTPGDDIIRGLGGNDIINGRGGNDILIGGPGDDTITGGAGTDLICGSSGADVMDGNGGDDRINGQSGDDTISGGSGADILFGGVGVDVIDGNAGNDLISGGAADDQLSGSGGFDVLLGNGGADVMFGNGGDDELWGGGGRDVIRGGNGNDRLYGLAGRDKLYGNAGSDTLYGAAGNDRLAGGPGDDVIFGGSGDNDRAFGGDGVDVCDSEVGDAACETGSTVVVPLDFPLGLFASSDGLSSVSLAWETSIDVDVAGYDVSRDGISVGTTTNSRFNDVPGAGGPFTYVVTAFDQAGVRSADSESVAIHVATVGACSATTIANGASAIIWEDAPVATDIALLEQVSDGTFQGLKWFASELDVVGTLDWVTEWGDIDPEYRVNAYLADGTIQSQRCQPVYESPERLDTLRDFGVPLTDDGALGRTVTSGRPVPVSVPQQRVPGASSPNPQDAPPACSAGGIYQAAGDDTEGEEQWIELFVPAGLSVTIDVINRKDSVSSGNWGGVVTAFAQDANGNPVGGDVGRISIIAPFYWGFEGIGVPLGDDLTINDAVILTNGGPAQKFLLHTIHTTSVRIDENDVNAHFRIEDITFTNSNGDVVSKPCELTEGFKCQSAGGNLYLAPDETYETKSGDILDGGCYTYDSCVAADDQYWGAPVIGGVAEWACENDEILEAAETTAVVIGGSLALVYVGQPGLAFGALTSLWTCDQSDNGFFTPAPSLDAIDGTCAATEIALGGVFGKLAAGAGAGTGLLRAATVACGWGAAEAATGSIAHAIVQPDQQPALLDTFTDSAIGCTTAGIIAGAAGGINRISESPRPSSLTGATSETTGGLTNLGRGSDRGASFFDDFSTDQGFSGVYDEATGSILAFPSLRTSDLPAGFVNRRGGHGVINRRLTQTIGAPAGERAGFTALLQADGSLKVQWLSRSVNGLTNPYVPESLRPGIIDALSELSGRTVTG